MAGKKFSFHFSCGNSTDGPIGFCGRVEGETKEEALEIMKKVLPREVIIRPYGSNEDNGKVEYIEAYITPENMTLEDIDEVNELDEKGQR
jgi:hypothetical protein